MFALIISVWSGGISLLVIVGCVASCASEILLLG